MSQGPAYRCTFLLSFDYRVFINDQQSDRVSFDTNQFEYILFCDNVRLKCSLKNVIVGKYIVIRIFCICMHYFTKAL